LFIHWLSLNVPVSGFFFLKIGVEKMHKDTKYVLFLDDDVRLHPGTIGALTTEMEKNPEVVPKLQKS
jgi:GT2 family glycosyltransferase